MVFLNGLTGHCLFFSLQTFKMYKYMFVDCSLAFRFSFINPIKTIRTTKRKKRRNALRTSSILPEFFEKHACLAVFSNALFPFGRKQSCRHGF